MEDKKKIKQLIKKCFRKGQGGWNESEDETEYVNAMMAYAFNLGLIDSSGTEWQEESPRSYKDGPYEKGRIEHGIYVED